MFCRLIIKRILLSIGDFLVWAPIMGLINWLAIDVLFIAIVTIKAFEWLMITAIYYDDTTRKNDILLTNWLKSWGGPHQQNITNKEFDQGHTTDIKPKEDMPMLVIKSLIKQTIISRSSTPQLQRQ